MVLSGCWRSINLRLAIGGERRVGAVRAWRSTGRCSLLRRKRRGEFLLFLPPGGKLRKTGRRKLWAFRISLFRLSLLKENRWIFEGNRKEYIRTRWLRHQRSLKKSSFKVQMEILWSHHQDKGQILRQKNQDIQLDIFSPSTQSWKTRYKKSRRSMIFRDPNFRTSTNPEKNMSHTEEQKQMQWIITKILNTTRPMPLNLHICWRWRLTAAK